MTDQRQTKPPTPPSIRLGIDFGGVIQGGGSGDDGKLFVGGTVEVAVKCPPTPGAIEAVQELVRRFDRRVWIVSKAGAGMQRKTLAWLEHHDFWAKTGMEPWSIVFVLHREQKREVAQALKLTHFIDDRRDVLEHLWGVVPHLYLFGVTTVDEGSVLAETAMPDWSHMESVK